MNKYCQPGYMQQQGAWCTIYGIKIEDWKEVILQVYSR